MSRCNKCRYGHDYPLSCIDDQAKFPSCGFKQRTKEQFEIQRTIARNKKEKRLDNDYVNKEIKLPSVTKILPEQLEDYVSKAVIGDVFYTNINMGYYTDHYMCYCTEEIINGSERPCWLKMVER